VTERSGEARPETSRPFVEITGLSKSFGDHRVLQGISLGVERGEILALLGPSGSGKTTLLRALAGFETPDAGILRVEGDEVGALPPARRRFGMVFQHYALFPHLTVGENVAFGLESHRWDRERIRSRVAEVLELVDLAGFEARRVGEISGGQQQRVALARALAPEPRVFLLDEPLSNLDPALRERTRRQLKSTVRRVGITTIFVTHEQEEAFDLGDRVAVLYEGRLQQVGRPEELYRTPATRFVAGFIGRAGVLPGTLEASGEVLLAPSKNGEVRWGGEVVDGAVPGERVELVVRPEVLSFADPGTPGTLVGRIVERRYAGPVSYFLVELAGGGEIEVLAPWESAQEGAAVGVALLSIEPAPRIFRGRGEAG
jgi:ABC-type Fe3+/spermidine/putrescine transport system ATPase subunit